MEEEGPASVEAIYDRIVRRGSVMFFGYKRPFRAIASAMSALEKSGEAVVHVKAGGSSVTRRGPQRYWQRVIPDTRCDLVQLGISRCSTDGTVIHPGRR